MRRHSRKVPVAPKCGKRRYPSYDAAVEGLKSAKSSNDARRHECRVYECDDCDGWHLTSSTGRAETVPLPRFPTEGARQQ